MTAVTHLTQYRCTACGWSRSAGPVQQCGHSRLIEFVEFEVVRRCERLPFPIFRSSTDADVL